MPQRRTPFRCCVNPDRLPVMACVAGGGRHRPPSPLHCVDVHVLLLCEHVLGLLVRRVLEHRQHRGSHLFRAAPPARRSPQEVGSFNEQVWGFSPEPRHWLKGAVEAIAGPVLSDARFAGRPVYASEVIVRADSQFQSLDDLKGSRWAINEPSSWSGYWVTLQRVGDWSFFREVVSAGFHEFAIQMVATGEVEGAAIVPCSERCAARQFRSGQTIAGHRNAGPCSQPASGGAISARRFNRGTAQERAVRVTQS